MEQFLFRKTKLLNGNSALDNGYFLPLFIKTERHLGKVLETFNCQEQNIISEDGTMFSNPRLFHKNMLKRKKQFIFNIYTDKTPDNLVLDISMLPNINLRLLEFIKKVKNSIIDIIPIFINKLDQNKFAEIMFKDNNDNDKLKKLISTIVESVINDYAKHKFDFRKDNYLYNKVTFLKETGKYTNELSRLIKMELLKDQNNYTKLINSFDKSEIGMEKLKYFRDIVRTVTNKIFDSNNENWLYIPFKRKMDKENFVFKVNPNDFYKNTRGRIIFKMNYNEIKVENILKNNTFYNNYVMKLFKEGKLQDKFSFYFYDKTKEFIKPFVDDTKNYITNKVYDQMKNVFKTGSEDQFLFEKKNSVLKRNDKQIGKFKRIERVQEYDLPNVIVYLKIN